MTSILVQKGFVQIIAKNPKEFESYIPEIEYMYDKKKFMSTGPSHDIFAGTQTERKEDGLSLLIALSTTQTSCAQ